MRSWVSRCRKIFGTAGVRGRYLADVNPEMFLGLGASLATYLKARRSVVGGDGRLTTPVLKGSVVVGLLAAGCDVVDVGLVPLPVLAWSARHLASDLGVYVTASHNPPHDNGLKAFYGNGMELLEEDEIRVEELFLNRGWRHADWCDVGTLTSTGRVIDDYIAELLGRMEPLREGSRPKVLVDTANGGASLATPRILVSMGARVFTLNSNIDGRFPGRHPEPRPDVLEPLMPVARSLNVDIFLAHDGDGDRLAVLSPRSGFVKQDRIIALLAKHILSMKKGTVVVSIDVGNSVRDVVESAGGKLDITKLGATHTGLLRHSDVVMTAEPWKFIDPEWGPWVDGIYQAALLVKLMIDEGKNIDELLSEVPDYPQARVSIEVPKGLRDEVYERLSAKLMEWRTPEAEVFTLDGVRVNYEDKSWILVRKSGTEPKVRIYGESLEYRALKDRVDALLKEVSTTLKKHGINELRVDGKIIP
ncbi:MAG: phosphopentomutase/phosphoglucosamine mutase [Zestosphaera sp.]